MSVNTIAVSWRMMCLGHLRSEAEHDPERPRWDPGPRCRGRSLREGTKDRVNLDGGAPFRKTRLLLPGPLAGQIGAARRGCPERMTDSDRKSNPPQGRMTDLIVALMWRGLEKSA